MRYEIKCQYCDTIVRVSFDAPRLKEAENCYECENFLSISNKVIDDYKELFEKLAKDD